MKQKTENTILTVVKAKLLYFILLRGKVKVATGQVAAPQLRPTPATLPYGRCSCSCSCSRRQPAPYQKVSSSDAVGQDDSKANMPMSTGKIQEMARSVLNRLDFITRDELNLRTSWASQGSGRQRRKTLAKKRGLGGTDTSKGEGRRRRKTQAKERGRTQAYSGLRKKQLSGAALPDAPLTHAFLEEFMKWGTLFVLNR